MKKKSRTKKVKKPSISEIFDNPEVPHFKLLNNILALVTIMAVAVVALETVSSLSKYHNIFIIVEYFSVLVFGSEYIARIYLSKNRLRYIFSFFGIIDLVAILPSLLGLTNLTFLKAARAVRIVRMLRMLRLAKFAKIKEKKHASRSLYKINLEIYTVTLATSVLILGSLFYFFEHNGHAESIPAGMYWSLKVILGGISYPQPETIGGTVTIILARFTSMLLLGMLMSLIGTMIRKLLIGSEKDSD